MNKIYDNIKQTHPFLVKEWDFDKNKDLNIDEITIGSHKKVWWKCDKGHSYSMAVYHRKDRNCPYCANKKILIGFNDFASTNVDLLKEWDFTKNQIKPTEVSTNSSKKVFWLCSNGHSYEASINKRTKLNRGCPICSNQKIIKGINDLATLKPDIANEWDFDKNYPITPFEISSSTAKSFWWKCEQGHSYFTSVNHKARGDKCPYCANKKILIGFNDFASQYPEIASTWSDKNTIKPTEVTSGSKKDIIWECPTCKNEWTTKIYVRKKFGCPRCKESKGEKIITNYLKKHNINYKGQYRFEDCRNKKTLPFDFGILDDCNKIKFLIEFDGFQHFEPCSFGGNAMENFENIKINDKIKTDYCKKNNITLIRINYLQIDNINSILDSLFRKEVC